MEVPTLAPFPAERLGRIQAIEADHFWFVARRRLVAHLVAQVRPPDHDPRILDCGSGTGCTVAALRSSGAAAVGVDLHAQSILPGLQAQGVLPDLPIASESVDIALALDVLEHVDDDAALQEISRLLRPGGSFVVTVPAHRWLWGPRDVVAGHLRRYTRRSLRTALTRNGFVVDRLGWYQGVLFPLIVVARLLARFRSGVTAAEELVHPRLNRLFTSINLLEVAAFERGFRLPFGSSLVAVARRPS